MARLSLPRVLLLGLAAAGLGCDGYGSDPSGLDLTGTWTGTVPRAFYQDSVRLELVQTGRTISGQGVRGVPCPADGQCYVDVTVMGTVDGPDVVLQFGPPHMDRYEGRVLDASRMVGTLTAYSDRPSLSLARTLP
jgi:hypothetical protein